MKHQINLYTALYPPKKRWPFSKKATLIGSLVLTLIVGGVGAGVWKLYELKQQYQFEMSMKSIKEKAFEQMKKEANASITEDKKRAELAGLKAEIKQKKALKKQLEERQIISSNGYLEHFIALARQDIRGIWLSQVILANNNEMVTLAGETTDPALVARLLKRLSREQTFRGVNFVEMKIEEPTSEENTQKREALTFVVSTHEIRDVEEQKKTGFSLF